MKTCTSLNVIFTDSSVIPMFYVYVLFPQKSEDEAASNGAGAEAGASGGEGGIGKGMKGLGGLTK